jgi:hypothetical protein
MPEEKKDTTNSELASMIEDLARMTHNGFEENNQRFGKVAEDLTILRRDIETGFHDLTHTLKPLTEKTPHIEADIVELSERVARLEKGGK